jgi:hypothetical protein
VSYCVVSHDQKYEVSLYSLWKTLSTHCVRFYLLSVNLALRLRIAWNGILVGKSIRGVDNSGARLALSLV